MKISSDKIVAADAVSRVIGMRSHELVNHFVGLEFSNISSMNSAVAASNSIVTDMAALTECAGSQANNILGLADLFECRDYIDSRSFGF